MKTLAVEVYSHPTALDREEHTKATFVGRASNFQELSTLVTGQPDNVFLSYKNTKGQWIRRVDADRILSNNTMTQTGMYFPESKPRYLGLRRLR